MRTEVAGMELCHDFSMTIAVRAKVIGGLRHDKIKTNDEMTW